MTETTARPNYKKTLNLPRTSFAMRANLAQNEPASQKRWERMKLYQRVTKARAGAEPFVFHDGPPYANGSIHAGQMLNKVLKDLVVRSKHMFGRQCRYVPGWDCHGLPIEHKVMTGLHESGNIRKLAELDDDSRRMAIRRECAKYAAKFQKIQAGQMKRLLTMADYDQPYLTMEGPYEQAVLEVFARLLEQGVVYRALKPVHWSIANQTALAEAELEYQDREDLSIYVDFEATDREAVSNIFGVDLDQTPSFMIWTTTPWTLPANLAVAVHERSRYALVQMDGNVTVVASSLVNGVAEAGGAQSAEILAEVDGAALVGLTYKQPLTDVVCPIVAAEYVTLEDGTGLVHTAPGHGEEDYQTGLKEGLEIYCPVKDDGTFDDTAPEWLRGMSVWDANDKVTERLRQSGHLFHSHSFMHSYPHDWRSKTPVIFRSTEQWFISVDETQKEHGQSLRQLALDRAEKEITFIPEWGRNRLKGMLESRPDWCISRQRSWGLPIPAFRMPDGQLLMTAASVRAVGETFSQLGSDAWFAEPVERILAAYDPAGDPDAPGGVEVASLVKTYDIFDVWFESGTSWNAAMRRRELGFPVDLYLEGSDQHRGWFQLSLLPSLGATGHSPFKSVLTHGFTVDKDGRKMSKSGTNALLVDDLMKQYGADVCRWWVSSLAFENDIKVDAEFFETAGETYRKVRNTLRFLLSNLDDFDLPTMSADLAGVNPASIDGYALQALATLQREVPAAYGRYEFRRVKEMLYNFCNEKLSAFYCAAVKDRLYCDQTDSPRRRQTQSVMWRLAETLCKLLAPIIPHTADEAYRALWKCAPDDPDRCVHMEVVGPFEYQADENWTEAMETRTAALKKLEDAKAAGIENPLDAEVVIPAPKAMLSKFEPDWADMLGVSRVSLVMEADDIAVTDLSGEMRCDRCWKRDLTTVARSDGGDLCDRCAEAVGLATAD